MQQLIEDLAVDLNAIEWKGLILVRTVQNHVLQMLTCLSVYGSTYKSERKLAPCAQICQLYTNKKIIDLKTALIEI